VLDVPGQITIDDALFECERQQRLAEQEFVPTGDLERLGDSDAYGELIRRLLELQGWSIHVRAPFSGEIDDAGTHGVMVIAAHRYADVLPVQLLGRNLAACAPQLMVECGKYTRAIVAARDRLEQQAAERLNPLRKAAVA
jgi:hypothetical protein